MKRLTFVDVFCERKQHPQALEVPHQRRRVEGVDRRGGQMKRKSFSKYKSKELVLPMGIPAQCFKNAMTLVIANPKRLRYVEGFVIDAGFGCDFIHHGWCKDVVTGKRHEVTPNDFSTDAVYVGKEFTRGELSNLAGDFLESVEAWTHQLTLQQEHDLLTDAGYDVMLVKEYATVDKTDSPEGHGDVVPLDSIDMNMNEEIGSYELCKSHGLGHSCDGWHYIWQVKESTKELLALGEGGGK